MAYISDYMVDGGTHMCHIHNKTEFFRMFTISQVQNGPKY